MAHEKRGDSPHDDGYKAIILVRDRKRIVLVTVMAVVIVGLLVYIMNLQPVEGDPIGRALILQTMFAALLASLPFMLFDREDHREQNAPIQVTAAGRRRPRWILLLVVACGALLIARGIAADAQLDPWWTSLLRQVGGGLLGSAAVLAFQLRKKRSTEAGPEPESGSDAGSPAAR